MYLGSLETTQDATFALGYASRNSGFAFVLFKLLVCVITRRCTLKHELVVITAKTLCYSSVATIKCRKMCPETLTVQVSLETLSPRNGRKLGCTGLESSVIVKIIVSYSVTQSLAAK